MRVRRARLADAAAIAAVHVRTWQVAYEHVFGAERLDGIDPVARERQARRFVSEEAYDVFVAEDADGRVVGFASAGPLEGDARVRELFAIYVGPEAWGTEAGPGLLAAAVAAMRDRGAPEAILWVLEDNPRARRFYERAGWYADGAGEGQFLGLTVPLVRYRIAL